MRTTSMGASITKAQGLQPVFSFVSILVIGLVLAIFVIPNERLRLPIILFSFFFGIIVAAIELRVIIRKNRNTEVRKTKVKLSNEQVKDRLARFVAELFDEDIPFDDMEVQEEINDHD